MAIWAMSDPHNLNKWTTNWLTAMRCRSQKLLSHQAWQASEAQAPLILATTFPRPNTLFISHLQYEDEHESVQSLCLCHVLPSEQLWQLEAILYSFGTLATCESRALDLWPIFLQLSTVGSMLHHPCEAFLILICKSLKYLTFGQWPW